MDAVCPLCGEPIEDGQPTVVTSHEEQDVTAHRSHFEPDDGDNDELKNSSPSPAIEYSAEGPDEVVGEVGDDTGPIETQPDNNDHDDN